MAKPDIENGHAKIANELIEALAHTNFSAYETRLLWVIIRKTCGWNKEFDRISYSQFEAATGIDRRHIARAINSLKSRSIITCTGKGYSLEYGVQGDYDKWNLTPKEATIIDTNLGNDLTPKEATITKKKSLPIQGESLPIQGDLTPKEATKSLPKEANTKAIKHYTKASTKAAGKKETFEEYLQKKVKEFPDLNIMSEWESCQVWYSEKGKEIKLPKTALNNWLKISLAKKMQFNGGYHGTETSSSRTARPYGSYKRPAAPRQPTDEEYTQDAENFRRKMGGEG